MKELQTTPEMCEHALSFHSQMEQRMCVDAWLAQDALAAHELLGLLRETCERVRSGGVPLDLWARVDEWVTP